MRDRPASKCLLILAVERRVVSLQSRDVALRVLDRFPLRLLLVSRRVAMPFTRSVTNGTSLSVKLLSSLSRVVSHYRSPFLSGCFVLTRLG